MTRVWTVCFFHLEATDGPEVSLVADGAEAAIQKAWQWLRDEHRPSAVEDFSIRALRAGVEVYV